MVKAVLNYKVRIERIENKSKVDQLYRRFLLAKFFVKGWGEPENLHRIFAFRKKMANKNLCYSLVDPHTPVTITKKEMKRNYVLYEGHFKSPFDLHLPGLLPVSSQNAYFQMILPHRWAREDYRPVCIQLAGTGDHVSYLLLSSRTNLSLRTT
ncbi:Abhydrolase domain containing 18 [Trinorchestia longiramus]|nr:Abhydrolase domain containing 18 [Trinorchestia longiramus]